MKKLLLLCLFATAAQGAKPIVREGSGCPPGYYRHGEYCTPARPDTKPAITRQGATCPPKYHRHGEYCVPSKADVDPPIVRHGSTCPPNFAGQSPRHALYSGSRNTNRRTQIPKGGARPGAGRKVGSGRWGEGEWIYLDTLAGI